MRQWLRDTACIFFGFPIAIGVLTMLATGLLLLWQWSHWGMLVIVWALFAAFVAWASDGMPPPM
jgi:type IV secretory pathway VirB3-like protein